MYILIRADYLVIVISSLKKKIFINILENWKNYIYFNRLIIKNVKKFKQKKIFLKPTIFLELKIEFY